MRTATDFIIEGRPQVVHRCFNQTFEPETQQVIQSIKRLGL